MDSELAGIGGKFTMPVMEVLEIFPGAFYVTDGENGLLAGCPPEIVKVLRARGFPAPQVILLPDLPLRHGESQVSVEFPLYQHLFCRPLKELQPLVLAGTHRRTEAARELLDLTLFGPDERTMRQWGLSAEEAEKLALETRWFHLKDSEGKSITLDKMVKTQEFQGKKLDLGWLQVIHAGENLFELQKDEWSQTIDLNFEKAQKPPYPVTPDLTVTTLVKLGVEVLGGATGFSTAQASSGLALCYNGNYILIDAIPFLNHHLRARGIARNQIHSLILTHIHDDHCNLVSLLQYNRKIQVLTTPVVYQMMLRKLALTMDRSEDRLKNYFTFIGMTPGETTDFFGLRIRPFWSSHSIPTIGFELSTTHSNREYTVTYTGDTQSLKDLKRMQNAGVIDNERYNEIAEIFTRDMNLLIADGGEGVIHGDPADAVDSPAERIVFLHLDKLSEAFRAQFTTASSGKRFSILRGETDYNLTRTIEFLMEYFPDMPPIWISNLLANQNVYSYNAGDIIIRQGTRSEGQVFMILTGYAQVVVHDGKRRIELASMEAGELIGEMSVITGKGLRNASVVALSPVTVTAFSEESFKGYIQHQNFENKLRKMWQNRELLQQNFQGCLQFFQQPVLRAFSENIELLGLKVRTGPTPLASVGESGGLIFPLGQELLLERGGREETVPAGDRPIFIDDKTRLITEAEFQYLLLDRRNATHLRNQIPAFRFFWEETMNFPVPLEG